MDVNRVRRLLAQERVALRFTDHAVIEARKDGLTAEDLEDTITKGELVEDYGVRALLLNFTKDDGLPCHAVLEYVSGTEEAVVVTAYVPDSKEWEPNWKKRRRKRRR
jgi:hypothetical protein